MIYSDKVMDHFRNPRNVGEIPDADGVGEVGNPVCGDMMSFYIKVKDNRLVDIKFKTFGCGAAIAVSSMVTEMGMGKTLEEAKKITKAEVAKELGGLPPNKMHCSNLGAEALTKAIEDYEKKKAGLKTPAVPAPAQEPQVKGPCVCQFCKKEIQDSHDKICKPCGAKADTNK
ncbi:MAG TPA: Fe-S cluster assembly scaffold protein NifU [Planctomycetota bacterium]|nr:Fe-S cluster assembly scaffold protein NifU [Planctomycetota bacterium]